MSTVNVTTASKAPVVVTAKVVGEELYVTLVICLLHHNVDHVLCGKLLCFLALPGCDAQGCSTNARCINETGALECRCKIGYEGNGTSCTAIDRCAESNLCHQFAICNNTGPGVK